jgi:hypothetical protein
MGIKNKVTIAFHYAASALLLLILLLSVSCRGESNKKVVYELRERCGKAAAQWAKARSGEILDYRAHYNDRLNKCFVLAKLSPVVSNNFFTSFDILYDVDENKEIGHHTTWFSQNGTQEHQQCIINGKYYGGSTGADAEEKWKTFVQATMGE